MLKSRLALEIYRHFGTNLPNRIRYPLKAYIDSPDHDWEHIGLLKTALQDTSYHLWLDVKHWHQRWTYVKRHYPEPHITHILNRYLDLGAVYIDVGANIGVHVMYAAAIVGSSGYCFAFEPNPHSFSRLQQHISRNKITTVSTYQTALGNEQGTIILHGCEDENVGSTLRERSEHVVDSDCEVSLSVGDDWLYEIPRDKNGIVKIDVEGFEYQVLQGMTHFIDNHEQFMYVVEVTDVWLRQNGNSAQQLFEFFSSRGFASYLINPHTMMLDEVASPPSDRQYDVLFVSTPIIS